MPTIATVQKWGNAHAVRLPKALALEVGLDFATEVKLTATAGGILLSPVRAVKRYKLSDLLAQYKGKNPHRKMIRKYRSA